MKKETYKLKTDNALFFAILELMNNHNVALADRHGVLLNVVEDHYNAIDRFVNRRIK